MPNYFFLLFKIRNILKVTFHLTTIVDHYAEFYSCQIILSGLELQSPKKLRKGWGENVCVAKLAKVGNFQCALR